MSTKPTVDVRGTRNSTMMMISSTPSGYSKPAVPSLCPNSSACEPGATGRNFITAANKLNAPIRSVQIQPTMSPGRSFIGEGKRWAAVYTPYTNTGGYAKNNFDGRDPTKKACLPQRGHFAGR